MNDQRPLAAIVAEACRSEGGLAGGDRVLVAVSGGADSTALALLLAEADVHGLSLELVLAHVDHGWRGAAEAAADRAAVEALARGLEARLVTFPPPADAVPTEDAARRWRYHCLDEGARKSGCAKVATGHHLRDQAETVLMRLERGSGRVGLRGIPSRRPLGEHGVEVIRPLLRVDPRRLRAWLSERGVAWREDATNEDLSRDRARARARLLAVEARGGSASHRLAALADRLRDRLERDEAILASTLDAGLRHHPEVPAVEAPRALLASRTPPFLDLALRRLGRAIRAERDGPWFTRRHLDRVRDLLQRGGALDLPRGLRFHVTPSRVWLRRVAPSSGARARLRREDLDGSGFDLGGFLASAGRLEAAVDADRLGAEAVLRTVAAGDVFRPWSARPQHAVEVLAWLARRQVPAWLRERQVVVEGEAGIAWVPGHRIDRDHAVVASTERVARLQVTWDP